jgi:BTB/POZ domain-containing adapter for CUL3-mediated RhoA degradation protein
LIDRCGKHFGTILNFLRDDRVPLPETKKELLELKAEAQYYCMQELVEIVDAQVKKSFEELEPICKVPLITSQREEQILISSTTKVSIYHQQS